MWLFCWQQDVRDLTCFYLGPRPMSISSSILGLIGGVPWRLVVLLPQVLHISRSVLPHATPFAIPLPLCAEHFLHPTQYNHDNLIQKRAFNNSLGGLVDHQPTQLKMILGMPRGPSKGNPPRISPLMSRGLFPSALMNLELI